LTGAGSGIGLECALHLASRGARVYGSVLSEAEEAALAREAASRGVTVRMLRLDVTRPDQITQAVAHVLPQSRRIDALVQCAGMGLRGFFEDLTLEEIRAVYDVNVFGVMALTQAVIPHMRKARAGRVVIVSSVAARVGSMTLSGYASSKSAVEGF